MNQTLVAYLRSLLKQKFYPKPNQIVQDANAMQNIFLMQEVMISTPTDLLFEKYVLDHYLEILTHLDERANSVTTLEDDETLLNSG